MSPPEPAKRLVVAALAAPAVLHLALVLHAASRHAAVFDEVVYPTAGYAYWTTGDYRLNREHPPVLKLLTGAAWLGSGVDVRSLPDWDVADEWSVGPAFLYGGGRSHRALLWRARLPVALLSVAAMLAVFAAARRLAGPIAALAAAALWALDPLVIAHAGLATTDLGARRSSPWRSRRERKRS